MLLGGEGFSLFYDSKQREKRVPRDKGRMLDAARVGTTSQIAEAARQSHASTDYSTDAISVHIYPAEILWELGIQIPSSTANRLLVYRSSISQLLCDKFTWK